MSGKAHASSGGAGDCSIGGKCFWLCDVTDIMFLDSSTGGNVGGSDSHG